MESGSRSIDSGAFERAAREEIAALHEKAAQLERNLSERGVPEVPARAAAAQQTVSEAWSQAPKPPPPPAPAHPRVVLKLTPEEHDERMGDLIEILEKQGITKAIAAAEAAGNPHLIDDFHRILVEYVREGLPAREAESKKYRSALSLALYEVTLPRASGDDKEQSSDPTRSMREFIALMEQFYRGMLQMDTEHGEYFSFEIANPAGGTHTSIYIAVPVTRAALFEKQLLSLYPQARLTKKADDYNAFAVGAETMAASAQLGERSIYSLRTFEEFPNDPIDVLLNAFFKLEQTGEGAAIQFVISPRDKGFLRRYQKALRDIREGVPIRHATDIKTGFMRVITELLWDPFMSPDKLPPGERLSQEDPRLKNIETKTKSPILLTNIRVVTSAATLERAQTILQDIEAPFQQFADTAGNSVVFKEIPQKKVKQFAHAFSYRLLDEDHALPLSAMELATLAHLPRPEAHEAAPELHQEKSSSAAAPASLPQQGLLLGINRFRGAETKVFVQPEDRLRHFYLIGQTGTGKSALLKNMVLQDIQSGAGVCFIDPHGTDVIDILSTIPPERMDDVIYFDPANVEMPLGLNMLEYDAAHPEQKTLVVDELFGIFKKLFGAVPESMGPAFEQYFRNSALLVMESPELGSTLVDITRVFADPEYRAQKIAACKNPIIRQFWEKIASQTTGEQALENYGPYVTNKFDVFTTNDFVRPMIAQQHSAFNFRELMDNRKILLVNLAKGRIGDLNANLLGLIIVGKFLIAALSRADSFGKDFPPFYLHIDEFQNFATPSIATIFSEARKYKLSLTVAHQFIKQLTEEIRDSVFGNVGNIAAFRIGADDAEYLEKQFSPVFSAADLIRVDNYNAHVKLLVSGKPTQPFNIETLPFHSGSMEHIAQMQQRSFNTYGRPRAEVEAEVARGLSGAPQEPATLAQSGL